MADRRGKGSSGKKKPVPMSTSAIHKLESARKHRVGRYIVDYEDRAASIGTIGRGLLIKPTTGGKRWAARDTYKYHFIIGKRTVCGGITDDLQRKERAHQRTHGGGHIKQIGRRTTTEAALKWLTEGGKTPRGSKKGRSRG